MPLVPAIGVGSLQGLPPGYHRGRNASGIDLSPLTPRPAYGPRRSVLPSPCIREIPACLRIHSARGGFTGRPDSGVKLCRQIRSDEMARSVPFSRPPPGHRPHWPSPAMPESARRSYGGMLPTPLASRLGYCPASPPRPNGRSPSRRSTICSASWPRMPSRRFRVPGDEPWRPRFCAARPWDLRRRSSAIRHRSGGC